ELLGALLPAPYASSQSLYFCLVLVGIRWTLRHGMSPHAPGLLASLALVRVAMGRFTPGRQLLDALQRMEASAGERWGVRGQQYVCLFIAGAWFHDVRTLDGPMRALYQSALEHGEIELAVNTEGLRLQLLFHA